jgi:hypothetical protein
MKKLKTNKLPWTVSAPINKTKAFDYNKYKWRQTSIKAREEAIICPICDANGIARAVIEKGKRVGVLDHIIRIEAGGSEYDSRNHIAMCNEHHNSKRGMESRNLHIPFKLNSNGDKVPLDKEYVINLLKL